MTSTTNTQLSIQLARYEERLENLIAANVDSHQQLLKKQDELCIHVNHEIEIMDKRLKEVELHGTSTLREVSEKLTELLGKMETRVCTLEQHDLSETSRYKGRMELFQWTSLILGIMLAGYTVLHFFGLF